MRGRIHHSYGEYRRACAVELQKSSRFCSRLWFSHRRRQLMEAVSKLRPATPTDLELLQEWDEQAHVIASDPNSDWGWEVELGHNPDWREQLIAELDGRPIGF